jgi:hypothetical protein
MAAQPGVGSAACETPADGPFVALDDPVEQWLLWEEQANLIGFRTSTSPVQVDVAAVPRGEVELSLTAAAAPELTGRFVRGDRVLWAKHPLNRDPSVSWFDAPAVEHWACRFTSSRTLAVTGAPGDPLFSLKLATDHPHPAFHQPEKTRLREEALGALEWVALLDRVDACLGPLEGVAIVKEVLVVLAAGGESGFLVRDLRLFQDGHHYLPALSLPWVGREIALAHDAPFDEFWGAHYAEPVGRAKARLFARYGLHYETPNPQNILVQLDRGLRPTGRLVFRDLGDAECATDALRCSDAPWTVLLQDLRPETRNSFWAFAEAGERSVAARTLEDWYARHDRAYFAEIAAHFPRAAPDARVPDPLAYWNAALRQPAGRAAVSLGFEAIAAGRRRR